KDGPGLAAAQSSPPQGEAHDMNRLQTERTAESNAMVRHLPRRIRRFASRSPNARIVKENDLMIRCEAVRDRRVPAIHVGVEVLQKEQRDRSRLTKTTVYITDSIGFSKSCRYRFVYVIAHGTSLNTPYTVRTTRKRAFPDS